MWGKSYIFNKSNKLYEGKADNNIYTFVEISTDA